MPQTASEPPEAAEDPGRQRTGHPEPGKPVNVLLLFMGTLREIREELQNIRLSLAAIRKAGTESREDEREQKLAESWTENRKIIARNEIQLTRLFEKFPNLIYSAPGGEEVYDWYSDEVTRLANQWERFLNLWRLYGTGGKELQGHYDDFEALICDMVLLINKLTIPDRVREHLQTLYPGQELDFMDNFGNELCTKDHAGPILEWIAAHPECINGVVDTANGRIYKVDERKSRQLMSILVAVAICAVGVLVALALPWVLATAQYPLSISVPNMTIANQSVRSIDFATADPVGLAGVPFFLATCFLMVVSGGLAHLLVGGVKQARSGTGTVLAVEGWIRWFHIREIKNWAATLTLIIGFLGMVFVLKTADFATAFLVGYSIDSVVDLFLARFDVAVTAKTEEIKEKIPSETPRAAT